MERKTLIVILGLLSIYFSWNIHQYPPVHVDEPWETITAYQLYFHGKLNNPVLQGPEFYQEHFVEPRILQSIVLGLFYKVFGLHLWVGRMVSVILGACVLLCFYYLLKRYQVDNYLIFFGVIILSTHHYFFIFSRTIRPEIYVTFIGFACFSALLKGFDTEKKIWFALTGFLMGIGMWTHPAFAIWCAALISMLFLEYQLKTFTLKKTSIVLLFFVIGLLPFIIYLIIEDAGNDFSHFWLQIRRGAVQNASFLTQTFFDEFSRYQEYASGTRLPIVILEIVFIILSFKSNDRLSRYSRVVILFHIILLPVLIKSRKARYLVPALPLLIILMLQTFRSFELEYLKNWFRKFAALHFIQRLLIVSGIFLLVFQVSAQSILMT
ncbi:glycosyltransferase family 39 protein, partial [bacterium]|nr:glycosyltransferase family 39 protein [bacterium]